MRPDIRDASFLWDMLEASRDVREFVRDLNYSDYLRDSKTRAAVERKVEIVGEAARRISQDYKEANPAIPWKRIIGQRHLLAHEYSEIEDPLIWEVATCHIPELIEKLEPLVPDLPPEAKSE